MSNSVPQDAYILGTREGDYIPLSVARPKFAKVVSLPAEVSTAVVFPEDINIVTLISSVPFALYLGTSIPSPDANGWNSNTYFGDADVYYDFILPKEVLVVGESTGRLKINSLVRWASIANEGIFRSS